MSLEQRIKIALGELHVAMLSLQAQLEATQKELADLKAKHEE